MSETGEELNVGVLSKFKVSTFENIAYPFLDS